MLTERYGFTDDEGNVEIITVEEILESYEIKDLNLVELQEEYVNTVDEYEEKLKEKEENYENLYSQFSSLQETVEELLTELREEKEFENINEVEESISSTYIIIFLIGLIVAFLIGKNIQKKN